jgi:hypothetical protein
MTDQNKKSNYTLLDELFNLFLDDNFQKEDEELFDEWDINVNKVVEGNMMLFRQLRTKARAELNRAKHDRVRAFLQKFKEGLKSKEKSFLQLADEIMNKPQYGELQPMFRNLTNLSENDKRSIVMDVKLLELLSEIEENYNKEINAK